MIFAQIRPPRRNKNLFDGFLRDELAVTIYRQSFHFLDNMEENEMLRRQREFYCFKQAMKAAGFVLNKTECPSEAAMN